MYASNNRKERRRNARTYKEPWTMVLLPFPGNKVNAGVYYDIMHTQWTGASKCSYVYEDGMTWPELLTSSKFYFAPLSDKFEIKTHTGWSEDTRFLFTVQGKGLMVNISFKDPDGSFTVTLFLKDCILDFTDLESNFQKKSSTLYTFALEFWRKCRMQYTKEQRLGIYDTYVASGHTDGWAKIMTGLAGQENLEYNICASIMNELLMPLLHIFRTLAFMEYGLEKGHKLLESNLQFKMSHEAIVDVEASCTNHRKDVSRVPITYQDIEGADTECKIEGDIHNFYNVYSEPLRLGYLDFLRLNADCKVINLDEVTETSKNGYFLVDASGNPMKGISYEDQEAAKWMITPTGLRDRRDGFAILGLYQQKSARVWKFVRFGVIISICNFIEEQKLEGFNLSAWQPLLNKAFDATSKGLRDVLSKDSERDLPRDVMYYTCSNELFERVKDTSNIKTLDQANYFIEGFLRMLRRRKAEDRSHTCFNTGFIDKEEKYVWLYIPNVMGKFSQIQPEVVNMATADAEFDGKYSFYRSFNELIYPNKQIYVNENSLLHVSGDREFRIPTELASINSVQLIEWVRDSIQHALRMLEYNPMYTQPVYSERFDCICHLIPLYTKGEYNSEHLAGALFIHKGRVRTIYSVDMARDHACLFNVPKAIWLPD